jgi:hypothetical protein
VPCGFIRVAKFLAAIAQQWGQALIRHNKHLNQIAVDVIGASKRKIMQTIIINLDRRPDRLAATQQQIDSVDWQSVFPLPKKFAAMDCQLIKTPIDWPYSAGAYACRLSHLAVLKMAKQTDDDVLI